MGPLTGLKIIEMAGIGPVPFCSMMLADMGADVIRIDKPEGVNVMDVDYDILNRGRRSFTVDLKSAEGIETVFELIKKADGLVEGFRPGVMERLGLGPEQCLSRNPKLVFGRMTGWGQDGPLAQAAGHDINYLAITGALSAIGTKESGPVPPLNLLADFGGGAMYLAFGMVCALYEARESKLGQVVDAAMVDGVSSLMAMVHTLNHHGKWRDARESNLIDGAAPFYGTYECADGQWISIGSVEPKFYAQLIEKLGLDPGKLGGQYKAKNWPANKSLFRQTFKSKTRDQWCEIMEGTDVCFAPVLNINEVAEYPQNKERGVFVEHAGVMQPAPAPRFSRTKPETPHPSPPSGDQNKTILRDWNI